MVFLIHDVFIINWYKRLHVFEYGSYQFTDAKLLNILKKIFASFTADASPAVKKKTVDEARVDPKRNLRLTDLLVDLRELCV
jgi:hypothetical protein